MGLFGTKRKFDFLHLGEASAGLPESYVQIWNDEEFDPDNGWYAIRIARMDAVIQEIEDATSETDAKRAAHTFLSEPDEALRFFDDVRQGKTDKLQALVLWERHRRVFPVALGKFQQESGLRIEQFINRIEHEWYLHAACLAHLRQFVTLEVWDEFTENMRAASHGEVIVPVLERVRDRYPREGEYFRYPTWLPTPIE